MLTDTEQASIGQAMIAAVAQELSSLVEKILDDSIEREIEKVAIEIASDLGKVKVYTFCCRNRPRFSLPCLAQQLPNLHTCNQTTSLT